MNEEQILLEWTLSEEEKDFIIEKSRGFENRLKCTGHRLCYLKSQRSFY